jgi:hypothetical protein
MKKLEQPRQNGPAVARRWRQNRVWSLGAGQGRRLRDSERFSGLLRDNFFDGPRYLGRRFALDVLSKKGMIPHRRFHVALGPCPLRSKKKSNWR